MNLKFEMLGAFLEIEALSMTVFGDSLKEKEWLNQYNPSLDQSPIQYINSGKDIEHILTILSSIAYGGAV